MIQLKIQFNGKSLTLPINPEELNLSRSAENEDIDIIGIGKATRKGEPSLYNLTIESFFPGQKSYFYTGVKPKTCVNFINEIWKAENKNNNVAKFVTTGLLKNINMYFVIEDFEWDYRAGEEDDIYYTLKIKQYRPYGVKLVKTKKVKNKTKSVKTSKKSRTSSTTTSNNSKKRTYKVQRGDCLWNIAKAASGKGSNWRELYNLNKKVIGSNPNLIKPGQILTLPDGWKGSFKVSKLKNNTSRKKYRKTTSTTRSRTSSNTKAQSKPIKGRGAGSAGWNMKVVKGPQKSEAKGKVYTRKVQNFASSTLKLVSNQKTGRTKKLVTSKKNLLTTKKSPLSKVMNRKAPWLE